MKIIHCLNHFFPDHIAGTEIYTLSLVQELQQKSIDCIVLIPNFGKNITEEYQVKGVRVIKYAEPSVSDRALLMGKRKPDGLEVFLQVLKTESPSIVHFHEFTSGNGISLHHIIAAKEIGYRVLMTFHLAGYSCKTGHLMYKDKELCNGVIDIKKCTNCVFTVKKLSPVKKNILYRFAMLIYNFHYDTTAWQSNLGTAIGYPFVIKKTKDDLIKLAETCDKLVVLARWYKEVLESNGIAENKIVCIMQGLPVGSHSNKENRISTDILRIVFIGRINHLKGIHLLIDAIRQLPNDKISLDIYGDFTVDEFSIKCKAQTAAFENIIWKGSIAPENVTDAISQYDLLCLPSLTEMSALIIQQAFAAGVAVLASDIYGNREQIVDGKNGWLFKFNDSDDLKMKLLMLLQNRTLTGAVKKNIPAPKTFSEVGVEYEKLYKQIL